jgi:hypothetical protein
VRLDPLASLIGAPFVLVAMVLYGVMVQLPAAAAAETDLVT